MKIDNVRYKAPATNKNHNQISKKTSVDLYKTPDLYLSAFLKSKGIVLHSIDKKKERVIFVFQNKGNVQGLINEYFNDSEVRVLSYKAALRDLRSIIFNYQEAR